MANMQEVIIRLLYIRLISSIQHLQRGIGHISSYPSGVAEKPWLILAGGQVPPLYTGTGSYSDSSFIYKQNELLVSSAGASPCPTSWYKKRRSVEWHFSFGIEKPLMTILLYRNLSFKNNLYLNHLTILAL